MAHRYLKEKDAAKLFSQLISGVWYIHQKKIVHRDLKLENLLLDRNRNVIITDFGFANRFEHRADDLMQTSCGSPCYAAPELVISEGLYVGSAVDIWSCGVILYAMLAGYLPFDDDPNNPDGDNINLLYKYIVNTPLSFPDYVSAEARDLLSMMLVPDPTRRADLRSIMVHPWLSAYVHIFSSTVDDLERAAMEQHQTKRLAYQRQMRQAVVGQSEPSRVARSQSARVDGMLNASSSTNPRTHSYRDNLPPGQPEYLYETSVDQSIYSSSSPPAPHSRNAVSLAVTPATSIGPDDDPFAPPSTVNIPVTISSPDDGPSITPAIQDIDSSYPPNGSAKSPTDSGKKKPTGGFRHTIQVEYSGDPHPQEHAPGSSHGKASRADASSARLGPKQDAESRDRKVSAPHASPRLPGEKASVAPSTDAKMPAAKPLPPPPSTPTPSRVDTTHLTPSAALRENQPQTPSVAISPASPSATNAEDKSSKSVNTATGSTGSGSSRHRKGLSVDKFGLGKIFGTNGDQTAANGMRSRVPSETSAAGTPAAEEKKTSSTVLSTNDTAKNSLLSPVSSSPTEAAKKNRRNTLTVMVEPFSRTIKRKGKTPVSETPAKENRDIEKLPPSSTASPSQTNRGTLFPSVAKEGHQTHDMPASTTKARNVMQWFRRKSNAKADGEESPNSGALRAGTDLSSRSQIPTPSSKTELERNGDLGRSAGETSFSFSRAGWKFNASTPAKDVLRIHHGAVDQTTITTRPPPEVIKHVCKVLEELGMEIKAESEYKYRCIRAKRRKSGGAVGLGFSTVGSGSGLAAFTMVGSAASGGVSQPFNYCSGIAHDEGCRSTNVVFLSPPILPQVAC